MMRRGIPKKVDTSNCKCFADKTFLYMKYFLDNEPDLPDEYKQMAMSIYHDNVRGEIIDIPAVTAAFILYFTAVQTKNRISQEDIATSLGIVGSTIRNNYRKLIKRYKLNEKEEQETYSRTRYTT